VRVCVCVCVCETECVYVRETKCMCVKVCVYENAVLYADLCLYTHSIYTHSHTPQTHSHTYHTHTHTHTHTHFSVATFWALFLTILVFVFVAIFVLPDTFSWDKMLEGSGIMGDVCVCECVVVSVSLSTHTHSHTTHTPSDFGTSEIGRCVISALVVVLTLFVIIQDWEWPYMINSYDAKISGINSTNIEIHCCQRW
jgi:hypothetical protein